MKKLLIHNNNTFLANEIYFTQQEQYFFDIGKATDDVDVYINDILAQGELAAKISESDVVFIKINLSKSALEYFGLRLACHIRLAPKIGDGVNVPIVLISSENPILIGRTSPLTDILFTEGVYLVPEEKAALETKVASAVAGKLLRPTNRQKFISRVNIEAPANYNTHHSITNEWCIFRWTEMSRDVTVAQRAEIKGQLRSQDTLYFKYLETLALDAEERALRQGFKTSNKESMLIPFDAANKAKIFYFDDEVGKGWGYLMKEVVFKDFTAAGAFDYFNDFKKGEAPELLLARLIAVTESKIAEGYYVFIIDLRLCDEDFEREAELTGIKLINAIRKLNPGVQIVVFTASRQAENVKLSNNACVAGYVMKETPEHLLTRGESLLLFKEFHRSVKKALTRAYLAKIFATILKIKKVSRITSSLNAEEKKFYDWLIANDGGLDDIFKILQAEGQFALDYGLLRCFSLLEKFADLYFVDEGEGSSGKVTLKDGGFQQVYLYSQAGNNLLMEYKKGNFGFQQPASRESIVDVTFFASQQMRSSKLPSGPDGSSLTKVLAVLKFRYGMSDTIWKRLIELRYLRSKIVAHDTGEVDFEKRKVMVDDLRFIFDIFETLFS